MKDRDKKLGMLFATLVARERERSANHDLSPETNSVAGKLRQIYVRERRGPGSVLSLRCFEESLASFRSSIYAGHAGEEFNDAKMHILALYGIRGDYK